MFKWIIPLLLFVTVTSAKVIEIKSIEEFEKVLNKKDTLLVFDLYADWCAPCKMLAPVLDEISAETKDAIIYKINTEKLRTVAAEFGVRSIPHVTFVKNKQALNTLNGVLPKEAYEQSIEILSGELKNSPDGILKNGVRTITLKQQEKSHNIHVYRGDKVQLLHNAKGALSLPDLEIKGEVSKGPKSDVTFTAKKVGAYPIHFSTDGSKGKRKAWLIVMQYNAPSKETVYKEIENDAFEQGMQKANALLLDVRTKGEYKEGHIKDATLIPVQELENRINELADYKNKPIYVYCRSGNRSTVASKMLLDKGYTEVYNLQKGIKGWIRAGKAVTQ